MVYLLMASSFIAQTLSLQVPAPPPSITTTATTLLWTLYFSLTLADSSNKE